MLISNQSVLISVHHMKFSEIKIQPESELKRLLGELRTKAHDLSVKLKLNQLKNTNELKAVKRDIARIMTHLHSLSK